MKWKVAIWSGLAVTLLLGCSSRQEVARERDPIAISLEQLSSYWVQEKQWSWFDNDEPALPAKPVKGYVEVRYQIDASGTPIKPEVVAAEPPGELEQSALVTLSRIRYSPAEDNPDAIPVEVTNRFEIEIN
ncbi:TonB family protein [Aeromonas fluvialis]|uniref:TonB family protein n=1 Tax=Aeromonas fluvialis TaxID=591962 RepID=UPI0005A9DE47|nr:TonB family protein [Aeromonas fluvialis]